MIIFHTEFAEYFNKKIHDFLHVEFIDVYQENSTDRIDWFFPKYLAREQKEKCFTTFEELFEWTGDKYWHEMTAFHEIGLYYFLEYMHDLRTDIPEFDSIYYDKEDRKDIEALWEKFDIKAMFEGSMKKVDDLAVFVHDIGMIQELCFEDTDFLMLPDLSNLHSVGDYSIEKMMGIDFDYYKEILPKDIRLQYKDKGNAKEMAFFDDIKEMLDLISQRVQYRGLHKFFWNNGRPVHESEIQRLLDSFFDLYLKGDKYADISRETDIGTGKVDFKFYKSAQEKLLIEVKLGSNDLKKGLEKQLIHYMNATNYTTAFYLIICRSEDEVANAEMICRDFKSDKNILPYILDVSEKTVASKL